MAIDPTIYRRSYEAAAGPAIDPMAMRRQQVVEEAAAADRDYRATQLQGEQAKLEAANRKQATLGQIGGMAAAGDGAGARRTALEAGEFDIIDKLDSMDDSQRKRTLEVTRSIAPVIASLKQLPPAMRMQAASSVLVERGLTPEQIAGLDLSDAGIDAKIGEAMTITEYFAQQKDNRDFDYRAGKDNRDFNYRAGNDAAGHAIQLRGQNMTDARLRENNAVQLGTIDKTLRKTEGDLRKEFNALPDVKTFREVAGSYRQIKASANKPNPTAADDISTIFSYMKMLDPGSVVREGEFATAQNSAGVPEQVQNAYNKALKGTRLNQDQRRNFVESAAGIVTSRGKRYNAVANEYRGYAGDYGASPDRIAKPVPDIGPQPVKSAASMPKIGTVENGYRFKGGDPAKPSSWAKQ